VGWLEIEEFTLAEAVDDGGLRAADEVAQAWSYRERPGLLRRTTARGEGRGVLVVTLFTSGSAPAPAGPDGAVPAVLAAIAAPGSYRRRVVADLDERPTAAPG
jgi:hypothetical protein